VVYLTPVKWGATGTVQTNPKQLLTPCIKALCNEDVNLIISLGGSESNISSEGCSNVFIGKDIPYKHALSKCDVFITNGGFGGVNSALSKGVPLIVAGRSDDKGEVAARIEWAGVGKNLRRSSPNPKAIREAVFEILQKSHYKRKAAEVRDRINEYDTSTLALNHLESLLRRKPVE
jgi:UDP:flavonoid glycosyltransferase YjiC (YdhE family)